MTENDTRHHGAPDEPADPRSADEPVLRRAVDPDAGELHNMGGAIGAAPDTAAGDRSDVSTSATGGFAEPVTGTTPSDEGTALAQSPLGPDDPLQEQPGGDIGPVPRSRTDEYVAIDPPASGGSGAGADGETEARLAQKRAETPAPEGPVDGSPGSPTSSERAGETPPHEDAERMESALRSAGPFLVDDRRPVTRLPDVEDGPGTSLT